MIRKRRNLAGGDFTRRDFREMDEMAYQTLKDAGQVGGRHASFTEALGALRSGVDVGRMWTFGFLPLTVDASGGIVESATDLVKEKIGELGSVSGMNVLDFAAGFGRDTLYLLRQGANVHAIDSSPHARKFVEEWRRRYKKKFPTAGELTTQDGRFQNLELGRLQFDRVLNFNSLHYAGSLEVARDFLRVIQEHTRVGGINLIGAANVRDEPCSHGFRSKGSELQDLYFKTPCSGGLWDKSLVWSYFECV